MTNASNPLTGDMSNRDGLEPAPISSTYAGDGRKRVSNYIRTDDLAGNILFIACPFPLKIASISWRSESMI